jgi:hypothetical protein
MCNDGWGTLEEIVSHGMMSLHVDTDAFVAWAASAYALTDDSWDGAGRGDPNDGTLPYGKVLTSIFLITYALSDNYIPQWHSTEDYVSCSRAASNRFHGPFYMRFIEYDGASEADAETGRTAARDRTNLHCPLFNPGSISDFPSHRAGVLLHEAWHHWQYAHGFDGSHPAKAGACTGAECDWYYFHGTGRFEFGTLDRWSTDPTNFRFHSPYQVEAEFFSDLAELSRSWVPSLISQTARDHGNILLAKYFINSVGYRIGQPRPF